MSAEYEMWTRRTDDCRYNFPSNLEGSTFNFAAVTPESVPSTATRTEANGWGQKLIGAPCIEVNRVPVCFNVFPPLIFIQRNVRCRARRRNMYARVEILA